MTRIYFLYGCDVGRLSVHAKQVFALKDFPKSILNTSFLLPTQQHMSAICFNFQSEDLTLKNHKMALNF